MDLIRCIPLVPILKCSATLRGQKSSPNRFKISLRKEDGKSRQSFKSDTMNQNQKLAKLQKEAQSEIPTFLKAAKLLKNMNGISISDDDHTFGEIKSALSFFPTTKEGKELKFGILKQAKKKWREGMFNGTFLID